MNSALNFAKDKIYVCMEFTLNFERGVTAEAGGYYRVKGIKAHPSGQNCYLVSIPSTVTGKLTDCMIFPNECRAVIGEDGRARRTRNLINPRRRICLDD